MNDYVFENVRHALIWSTEVLRAKTFANISKIYEGNVGSKAMRHWSGQTDALPENAEEATLLSVKIYKFVYALNAADKELILMKYWGDFYDKNYLKSAVQIKEAMRLRGQHVRLNYRFSLRQMAVIKNVNYKKIERELLRIENELATQMSAKGLIEKENNAPLSQVENEKSNSKTVSYESFCHTKLDF